MKKRTKKEEEMKGNEAVKENDSSKKTSSNSAKSEEFNVKRMKKAELVKLVTELEQEKGEFKEKFLRTYAEFQNFRKRAIRERADIIKLAAQDTLTALLPVLDDIDRAKKNAEENNKTISEGVALIFNKLYNILAQQGLKIMETGDEEFNPEFHDAIAEIPAPDENMKGKIIDTVEKGYYLSDKIIRHAKVVVGK